MNKSKPMSALMVGAVLFAFVSVILCVTYNKGSYSANIIIEKKWDVQASNVSDVIYSQTTILDSDPVIADNIISLKATFSEIEDYVQFFFDIENKGNIDAIVKNIKVEGIDKDKVQVSIVGLEKNDIINGERYIDNVKVIIECIKDNIDENGIKQPITQDINIVLDIEKKE